MHVLSAVGPSDNVKYSPARQVSVLMTHAVAAFVPSLNSVSAHAVHVLSPVCTFDAVKYLPAGHSVFFALQAVSAFVPALKSPDAHAVQVASLVLPSDAVKYSPAGHSFFFATHDVAFAAYSATVPGWHKDADVVWTRLIVYLASPQSAALDAEVGAWIPAPVAIAQHEHDQLVTQLVPWGFLGLAASAFLRLGRDGDAVEAAQAERTIKVGVDSCAAVSVVPHAGQAYMLA